MSSSDKGVREPARLTSSTLSPTHAPTSRLVVDTSTVSARVTQDICSLRVGWRPAVAEAHDVPQAPERRQVFPQLLLSPPPPPLRDECQRAEVGLRFPRLCRFRGVVQLVDQLDDTAKGFECKRVDSRHPGGRKTGGRDGVEGERELGGGEGRGATFRLREQRCQRRSPLPHERSQLTSY